MSCVVQLRVSENDPRPIFAVWHTFSPPYRSCNMNVLRGQPSFLRYTNGTVYLCAWCQGATDLARQLSEDGISYHMGIHEDCAKRLVAAEQPAPRSGENGDWQRGRTGNGRFSVVDRDRAPRPLHGDLDHDVPRQRFRDGSVLKAPPRKAREIAVPSP